MRTYISSLQECIRNKILILGVKDIEWMIINYKEFYPVSAIVFLLLLHN